MIKKWSVFAGILCFAGTAFAGQAGSDRIAVVNGETITAAEVAKVAAPDLDRIELEKTQFEVNQSREKNTALQDALDKIVEEKVFGLEAKKRNITVEELVQLEVAGATTAPTDEEVVQFYNVNKARINGALGDNAVQIRDYLLNEAHQTVFEALIERLAKQYGFKSYLEPDRTPVVSAGHPSQGVATAPVTIVEFSDFECPYCGGLYPTLKAIQANYREKVRIVYRQFPLTSIHPHAQKAAEASLCANEQNQFWGLHDAMFTDQQNLTVEALKAKAAALKLNMTAFNSCLDGGKYVPEILSDINDGARAGVTGTPAMFINGRFLGGAQPYADIQKIIDDELQRAAAK